MRIGFATIYSWRPHVEHTWFLAQLVQRAGHEVRFLTCDGDLPDCYTRELREGSRLRECMQCRIGGIRSYTSEGISSIGAFPIDGSLHEVNAKALACSSASTLGRFESLEDYQHPDFESLVNKLAPPVQSAYSATREWIAFEKLDAVCVFNGRIDVTRAVFEAAKSMGIQVVSHERTWFGDGIQLLPGEHCLGLSNIWRMTEQWSDRALTRAQAHRAASLVARRFLKRNQTEWRAYNQSAVDEAWPARGGPRKFLILPSSTNEVWGHPDWTSGWQSPLEAFEAVIEKLELQPGEIVLRCHPNWSEKIGKKDGHLPEAYYSEWARQRGIHCIASHEVTSTMNLIAQCDALLVSVGSAALEAGVLGKPVISIAPSVYHRAGFTRNVQERSQLNNLDPLNSSPFLRISEEQKRLVARQALRFAYTMVWRVPQYVDQVRAKTTTKIEYAHGADPQRLIDLFLGHDLQADDDKFDASSNAGEDAILDQIAIGDWEALFKIPMVDGGPLDTSIRRKGLYKLVDSVRNLAGVGDR